MKSRQAFFGMAFPLPNQQALKAKMMPQAKPRQRVGFPGQQLVRATSLRTWFHDTRQLNAQAGLQVRDNPEKSALQLGHSASAPCSPHSLPEAQDMRVPLPNEPIAQNIIVLWSFALPGRRGMLPCSH
jgi:hypothetical protein